MVLSAKVTMNLPNTAIVTVATELPRRRPQMPRRGREVLRQDIMIA